MGYEFILSLHTKISIMSHWSIKTGNFLLYFLFCPWIRLEKGKLRYQLFWCKCKFLLVNERKKWRVWIKKWVFLDLIDAWRTPIKSGTSQKKVWVWQNTIFTSKSYKKKKKEKSGRYFEHWLLKYHTHYYPSVEIWVIAVWCLGKLLFF